MQDNNTTGIVQKTTSKPLLILYSGLPTNILKRVNTMKTLISTLLTIFTIGLLGLTPSGLAQTPDEETPANEGICDELEGATPGLFGLCVAFCEAQDHASLSNPITEDELDALMNSAPSGRILANYNKKKQDGDPDMPCIKVEEPCPCWDSLELDDLASAAAGAGDGTEYHCIQFEDILGSSGAYIMFRATPPDNIYLYRNASTSKLNSDPNSGACLWYDRRVNDNINTYRSLSISSEQFDVCNAQVRQRITDFGLNCLIR